MDCGKIARFEPNRRHISDFFGAKRLAHLGRQVFFFRAVRCDYTRE
jgi:hypothetical protein